MNEAPGQRFAPAPEGLAFPGDMLEQHHGDRVTLGDP
jgi:hypothetical protein